MRVILLALLLALLLLSACDKTNAEVVGGFGSAVPVDHPSASPAPPPNADPGFGEVAFKTFRSGGNSVRFNTQSKAEHWWANMAGETVHGAFEQHGPEIVIHWDPKYTNNGASQERFRQLGPCSLARYERTDRRTGKVIEDSMIYQQSEPRCDTVRITK